MKVIVYLIVISCYSSIIYSQPIVYSNYYSGFKIPFNFIESENSIIVNYWNTNGKAFGLRFFDTLGVFLYDKKFGTDSLDLPTNTVRNNNNEIMLLGRTFLYNANNAFGYVFITDTLGNYKREFPISDTGVLSSEVYNALFLNGFYYFIGTQFKNNTFPNNKIFICKTDTLGNIVWNKSDFETNTRPVPHIAIESSHNNAELLIGAKYIDSIINNKPYYSYYFATYDTNGVFIQRHSLPYISNVNSNSYNEICKIQKTPNHSYLIYGDLDVFKVDSNYNLIERDSIRQSILWGDFGSKIPNEESYIVGGFMGFIKVFNGTNIFIKDFSGFSDIISVEDVIPTKDRGYIALLNCISGTRIIKMDCAGNFVNASWCAPVSSSNYKFQTISANIATTTNSWKVLLYNSNNNVQISIYNLLGEQVYTKNLHKGVESTTIDNTYYTQGIYLIKLEQEQYKSVFKVIK